MAIRSGEELKRTGALPPARVVDLALQVCGGLEHAHASGLVHRDIKPGNLLLSEDRTVKIADFGIARAAQATKLTQIGSILGTAAYLAPEQRRRARHGSGRHLLARLRAVRAPDGPYAVRLRVAASSSSNSAGSPSRRSASCAPTCRRSSRRPSCAAWPAGPNTGPRRPPNSPASSLPAREPPARPSLHRRPRNPGRNGPAAASAGDRSIATDAHAARPHAAEANDVAPLRHRRGARRRRPRLRALLRRRERREHGGVAAHTGGRAVPSSDDAAEQARNLAEWLRDNLARR